MRPLKLSSQQTNHHQRSSCNGLGRTYSDGLLTTSTSTTAKPSQYNKHQNNNNNTVKPNYTQNQQKHSSAGSNGSSSSNNTSYKNGLVVVKGTDSNILLGGKNNAACSSVKPVTGCVTALGGHNSSISGGVTVLKHGGVNGVGKKSIGDELQQLNSGKTSCVSGAVTCSSKLQNNHNSNNTIKVTSVSLPTPPVTVVSGSGGSVNNKSNNNKKGSFSLQNGYGQPVKAVRNSEVFSQQNGHCNTGLNNINSSGGGCNNNKYSINRSSCLSAKATNMKMDGGGMGSPVLNGHHHKSDSGSDRLINNHHTSPTPQHLNDSYGGGGGNNFVGATYTYQVSTNGGGGLDTDSDDLSFNGYGSGVFSEEDLQERFHVNETPSPTDSLSNSFYSVEEEDEHPFFIGIKDVRNPDDKEMKIVSNKGTIRGVKNRVKAGIATFLQQNEVAKKNFQALEKGKIVLYTTSMMIVRETHEKCKKVKNILQTHMIKYEERDIFMSRENQRELAERLGIESIDVPQVFVEGHFLGSLTEVERLNENGELRKIFKRYKKISHASSCDVCGGYRYIPCTVCHGSRKSVHRNHFTTEFCALRCIVCDENGLVKCESCNCNNSDESSINSSLDNVNTKL